MQGVSLIKFFPGIKMVAWGKVTFSLLPHLFFRGCWLTFKMHHNDSVVWLFVYAALHNIIPRLHIFLSATCPGFLFYVGLYILNWRDGQAGCAYLRIATVIPVLGLNTCRLLLYYLLCLYFNHYVRNEWKR